ncbi:MULTISPECIES: SLC13 family permease [unclassified Cetobacterium]|uniref:SLC13 family permease n=1 Tax=unclassified Cetobacterium TaxID=2630983 RepID=UPI000646E51E|nr:MULTISPECIES: SLC13 family permease [unclassified Cetobacterium]
MNPGFIALITLFLVIALGFLKKINVGILAITGAGILSYLNSNFEPRNIGRGFSGSLFLTLLGISFLFCIVQNNGVLEKIVKSFVIRIGKKIFLIPIIIYLVGLLVAAVGPGCIPAVILVLAISVPLSHKSGYNPVMLMLIGSAATYAGRFTSITPEGILVSKLLNDQGITDIIKPLFINATIVTVLLSIIFFFAYKGHQVKAIEDVNSTQEGENLEFDKNDKLCLLGIAILIIFITIFKMDVGISGFIIGVFLILMKVDTEKNVLRIIPWNTIVMVTGVGVLMSFVISSGGIKLLTEYLSAIMGNRTAGMISGIMAGSMSWFSSTLGVVLPTLLPTVGGIIENLGNSIPAADIVTSIAVTSSFAGFSPMSTIGALIISALSSDAIFSKLDSKKIFIELLGWSVFCVAFVPIMSLLGLFRFI